jgi:hypothetical protein
LACVINILGVVTLYKIFEENYVDIIEEVNFDFTVTENNEFVGKAGTRRC